ncbi:MAG: hypothetical protein U0531_00810 [Dehalococcoidia bacterium]
MRVRSVKIAVTCSTAADKSVALVALTLIEFTCLAPVALRDADSFASPVLSGTKMPSSRLLKPLPPFACITPMMRKLADSVPPPAGSPPAVTRTTWPIGSAPSPKRLRGRAGQHGDQRLLLVLLFGVELLGHR